MNDKMVKTVPAWLMDKVIYQIFLRSFTKEGTIKAATKRLPRVAELGVDIVYLCPFFTEDDDMNEEFWSERQAGCGSRNPKNPYRIKDYYNIDEEYGNNDDLHEFISTARNLNLKVMFDLVYYHCGPKAVFIKDNPDFVKRLEDGSMAKGGFHFPILNFDNPELREYLIKNMEYLMNEFQVDGFRCDIATSVPLDFWEKARKRIEKINPDVFMLSEGDGVNEQVKAFDLNYTWGFTGNLIDVYSGKKPATTIIKQWHEMKKNYAKGTRFIRYFDNHDLTHDNRNDRFENRWGVKGADSALALIFALDGVPFLYNGQEICDVEPHSIFDYFPIDWQKANSDVAKKRFELCQKLCYIQHHYKAISRGDLIWLDNDTSDGLLTFIRKSDDETLLAIINVRNKSFSASIASAKKIEINPNPVIADGVNNIKADENHISVDLRANAYAIYQIG